MPTIAPLWVKGYRFFLLDTLDPASTWLLKHLRHGEGADFQREIKNLV